MLFVWYCLLSKFYFEINKLLNILKVTKIADEISFCYIEDSGQDSQVKKSQLSRGGEICVANLRPPCHCCSFGELYIGYPHTPFLIFQSFATLNPNSSWICFYKKNANSSFGATKCAPFWEIGVLPIHPIWSNLKFFYNFLYKFQIKRGSI